MDEHTEDNRRGLLSAAQHARLSALPGALSWWARSLRTHWNLAELGRKSPEGLAADLADRRVECAEGTLRIEASPAASPSWVVRLDDGQALSLAPGVYLPPGRQRLYLLPRSRWVVHGEPRTEQWQDYRALVLQAQRLGQADVAALRAGRLPPRYGARLRSRVRAWWIPATLWIAWLIGAAVAGAVTWENRTFTVVLCLVAAWGARRLFQVHRDVRRGAVSFVDGPVRINVISGRLQNSFALIVDGVRLRLPRLDAELVVVLQEGVPCRLYHTSGLFVAIEPLMAEEMTSGA